MPVCIALAQGTNVVGAQDQPSFATISTASLEFEDKGSVDGLPGSPVTGYPMQCGTDGSLLMQVAQLPELSKLRIYRASAKEVQTFAVESIPELQEAIVVRYFGHESGLVALVRATREPKVEKITITTSKGDKFEATGDRGERRYYLVEFDRDAAYKRTVRLDKSEKPAQFGVFESGNFLVLGIEPGSGFSQLKILASDGKVLSIVDMPHEVEEWSKGEGNNKSSTSSENLLNMPRSQFVSYNKGLLMAGVGMRSILEIAEGGAIRRVGLHLPDGQTIDSLFASSTRWYVRVNSSRLANSSVKDQRDPSRYVSMPTILYEVSPADGTILRRIDSHDIPASGIACVHDGQFISFQYNRAAQKFERWVGEIKQ